MPEQPLPVNGETGSPAANRSRFTTWIGLAIFSCICLSSSAQVKNGQESPSGAAKWSVACSAISLIICTVFMVSHLLPSMSAVIVGTKVEGVLTLMLVCFWAALVSIVTNANNDLSVSISGGSEAVDGDVTPIAPTRGILNGNLYYFSWAGFVTAIVLSVQYLRAVFGVDVVGSVRNYGVARLTLWAGMLAAALVVMGSSARVYSQDCTPNLFFPGPYCERTRFGIVLGILGVVMSIYVVSTKICTPAANFLIELGIAVVLSSLNAFGVAYLTSPQGPGSGIGNLYYFSWISLLCSLFLTAECFAEYTASPSDTATAGDGDKPEEGGDIEVETLQDHNMPV